ncbi:MAG TPA: hypothetical protein VKS22_04330 [Candidatus Binataceae bacterium]|nr:hypothetical protein [Candidatus Binataceae bacterium]
MIIHQDQAGMKLSGELEGIVATSRGGEVIVLTEYLFEDGDVDWIIVDNEYSALIHNSPTAI